MAEVTTSIAPQLQTVFEAILAVWGFALVIFAAVALGYIALVMIIKTLFFPSVLLDWLMGEEETSKLFFELFVFCATVITATVLLKLFNVPYINILGGM